MKKRILLIGYNYFPEPTGIGKYNGEMMGWLAQEGHACSVLTTYPYYPYWKVQEPYKNSRFSFTVEKQTLDSGASLQVYRVPMYVPENPSGLKRIIQDFTFTLTAFFLHDRDSGPGLGGQRAGAPGPHVCAGEALGP